MKELILTKSYYTRVDDRAGEILDHYTWYANEKNRTTAFRSVYIHGWTYTLYLHRLICGVPQCFGVKWLNENRLDNQYENFAIIDGLGNRYKFKPFTGKSDFKGVYWSAYNGLWEAKFFKMTIGYYTNEIDAARAYNKKMNEIYIKPGRGRLNSIPVMNKYLRLNK